MFPDIENHNREKKESKTMIAVSKFRPPVCFKRTETRCPAVGDDALFSRERSQADETRNETRNETSLYAVG